VLPLPRQQEKLAKAVRPTLEEAWAAAAPGLSLELQFGWLTQLPPNAAGAAAGSAAASSSTRPQQQQQQLSFAAVPLPPESASLEAKLEFMLTTWKQRRCLLPHKHDVRACAGFHVINASSGAVAAAAGSGSSGSSRGGGSGALNSNEAVFDARRPPISSDGSIAYMATFCP
jgi:hypothetical protein